MVVQTLNITKMSTYWLQSTPHWKKVLNKHRCILFLYRNINKHVASQKSSAALVMIWSRESAGVLMDLFGGTFPERRGASLSVDPFIHNGTVKPPRAVATSPPRLFKRSVKKAWIINRPPTLTPWLWACALAAGVACSETGTSCKNTKLRNVGVKNETIVGFQAGKRPTPTMVSNNQNLSSMGSFLSSSEI